MSKSTRQSRKQKQDQNKRRFDAIKDLMSTFAMSTVAVVAAVVLIPSSPKAEITKAIALNEEIVYQVQVTDEDNALDLSTLVVVLENQSEYYEQPITLGEFSGHFEGLQSDTEYRLSVYGSKGFGQERLDTMKLVTKERIGGTILSVVPQGVDFETSYLVNLSVHDPDLTYTSITLYYGFPTEFDEEIIYSSINVIDPALSVELFDIFTSETFHIYLEGNTIDGPILLDEIWVTPAYQLYASVYLEYINDDEVGFYAYGDVDVGSITYQMNVYRNNLLVTSKTISSSEDYEGIEFSMGGLAPDSMYQFECTAIYKNPVTLRTEETIIYEQEITTLSAYSYTVSIEEIGEFLEVTLIVNDPDHHFQIPYYDAYDVSGEHPMFLSAESFTFINNGTEKSVTFSIPIPIGISYEILIGMRSDADYTINQIIEIITND